VIAIARVEDPFDQRIVLVQLACSFMASHNPFFAEAGPILLRVDSAALELLTSMSSHERG
jgi:hypothetical protein